ncbi:unnamed protein product [Pleuronectes platessa]|uniref:Uncharacterized protein n=1 Tax=Pleuronectes platessa TaxID=8262 RepID=A0A9N7YJQ2_PLEPL|nr:unnamed protein product [Pleuronectes platessa]
MTTFKYTNTDPSQRNDTGLDSTWRLVRVDRTAPSSDLCPSPDVRNVVHSPQAAPGSHSPLTVQTSDLHTVCLSYYYHREAKPGGTAAVRVYTRGGKGIQHQVQPPSQKFP